MAIVLQGQGPEAHQQLIDEINKIQGDLSRLRADFENHVHSGVTAGGVNTGVRTVGAQVLTSAAMVRATGG